MYNVVLALQLDNTWIVKYVHSTAQLHPYLPPRPPGIPGSSAYLAVLPNWPPCLPGLHATPAPCLPGCPVYQASLASLAYLVSLPPCLVQRCKMLHPVHPQVQ